MARTLAEIIARAETLAQGTGLDPSQSPVLDGTMTAETIYPSAVRFAIRRALDSGKPGKLANLATDHLIEIVDESGDMPATAIREFLEQNAFLPDYPFSSYLPHPDYQRTRFDNLLCYFTFKNGQLISNCAAPKVSRSSLGVTVNEDDDNVYLTVDATTVFSADDVGKRIQVLDAPGGNILVDAIIATIVDTDQVTVYALATGTATSGSGVMTVYDTDNDTLVRTETSWTVTAGSNDLFHAATDLTAADDGRRALVTKTSDGSVIFDGIVDFNGDEQSLFARGKALASSGAGGATIKIYYSGLKLNIPTVPVPASSSADSGLSDEMADDVVNIIAAVLKGEIPLAKLVEKAG